MAQVLAPGLVEVEGDMPCFPKHTIRASTSCGFPSGTLNMCVYDRSAGLKRMLACKMCQSAFQAHGGQGLADSGQGWGEVHQGCLSGLPRNGESHVACMHGRFWAY